MNNENDFNDEFKVAMDKLDPAIENLIRTTLEVCTSNYDPVTAGKGDSLSISIAPDDSILFMRVMAATTRFLNDNILLTATILEEQVDFKDYDKIEFLITEYLEEIKQKYQAVRKDKK